MIADMIKDGRKLHFTLIDPDKQTPVEAGALAAKAAAYGTDAIMIGGSTAGHEHTDAATKQIKESCKLPTILFPSTAAGLSKSADHIFWMMLMNSKDRRFLVGEQTSAAPYIEKLEIDPIGMGYIVISTSKKPTTVEVVGDVDEIRSGDIEKAISYALCAKYFGMECVYLEAGSGADTYVSQDMIRSVKKAIDIPLIVGGGITDAESALKVANAGADIVVTGTIAEREPEKLKDIIKAIKNI